LGGKPQKKLFNLFQNFPPLGFWAPGKKKAAKTREGILNQLFPKVLGIGIWPLLDFSLFFSKVWVKNPLGLELFPLFCEFWGTQKTRGANFGFLGFRGPNIRFFRGEKLWAPRGLIFPGGEGKPEIFPSGFLEYFRALGVTRGGKISFLWGEENPVFFKKGAQHFLGRTSFWRPFGSKFFRKEKRGVSTRLDA